MSEPVAIEDLSIFLKLIFGNSCRKPGIMFPIE